MKLATLCYVRKDHHTLMVHRIKKSGDMHFGKWNGLGGKIENGETPEECAIREIKEECGLFAKKMLMKGFLSFPGFSKGEDWYAFVFVIDDFEGQMIDSPEGDLQWIPDEKLLELDLWEGDRIFLKWLDKAGFFSAKFIYHDGRLTNHDVKFY